MNESNRTGIMDEIVSALREGGYEPYAQLYGYLKSGDVCYITRRSGARDKIKLLNREDIQRYMDQHGTLNRL